jgi:hypothetical protein
MFDLKFSKNVAGLSQNLSNENQGFSCSEQKGY